MMKYGKLILKNTNLKNADVKSQPVNAWYPSNALDKPVLRSSSSSAILVTLMYLLLFLMPLSMMMFPMVCLCFRMTPINITSTSVSEALTITLPSIFTAWKAMRV